jgi:uncharacterized protein (DUF849 family)
MSLADRLIINAAITGMVPTKADNPHVPITPDEIMADVRRCADAGASIIHLHARDDNGNPTPDKQIYAEILRRARHVCPDVILCVSTSGRTHKSFEDRSAALELTDPAPEMASLTLGSMNFPTQASLNAPDMIRNLALKMRDCNIRPELEIFELGMAEYTHFLLKRGILHPPLYANILLGNKGTLSATESNLKAVIAALPAKTTWAAAGIGRFQLQVNTMAIHLGGHVRVGLEDNLWYDDARTLPATNASQIERLVRIARAAGREPATPAEARQLMGLPPPSSHAPQTAVFSKEPAPCTGGMS